MIVSDGQDLPVVHNHARNYPRDYPMNITSKSTKTEILAAYNALLKQQQAQVITAPLVASTAKVVYRESLVLAQDVYKSATFLCQWISQIVDILRQPVLR